MYQHASLTIRVAVPIDEELDSTEDLRKKEIHRAVESALSDAEGVELRYARDVSLDYTESDSERDERLMAEAESEALARSERAAERALEEGRW